MLYKHNEGKYKIVAFIDFEDEYKKFISDGDIYSKDEWNF
ncbi:hypothetical protein SALWKB2_0166 [Snodgrassella alvi wkB2]|nr:hypothetical protein SALWKB2_0166 [Snodgrassella alvi wkB2]